MNGDPAPNWAEEYEIIMGSDIDLDGMYLEARSRTDHTQVVLFAFYSDVDGTMTFEPHDDQLPPDFVAWFRTEATRRLPPVDG